jgi:hypothetical protein
MFCPSCTEKKHLAFEFSGRQIVLKCEVCKRIWFSKAVTAMATLVVKNAVNDEKTLPSDAIEDEDRDLSYEDPNIKEIRPLVLRAHWRFLDSVLEGLYAVIKTIEGSPWCLNGWNLKGQLHQRLSDITRALYHRQTPFTDEMDRRMGVEPDDYDRR